MDVSHLFVDVSNATNNLAEHRSGVVMWKCRTTVTLKDIVEGTGRAEEHEEKVGVRGVGKVEERENMLVGESFPYGSLILQAFAGLCGVDLGS